jgi:hypothetical protein
MLGRIHAEQISGPCPGLILVGDVFGAGHAEAEWPAVGEPFVVGQHQFDVVVPRHEVDLHAQIAHDRLHAGGFADFA